MLAALTQLDADVASGAFAPAPSRRGRARRAGARPDRAGRRPSSAASCAPAGPATTRSPRWSGCTCATTPGSSPRRARRLIDALVDQAEAHHGRGHARPHPPAARPAGAARHHLLAHAWPLLRDVERLRDWDRRAARFAVRLGRAGRLLAGPGPGGRRRASSASTRPAAELDRRHRLPGRRRRVRLRSPP